MFNDLSLSYLSIEAWAIEKKKREKMACPRSTTQKKIGTHEGPSVEKKIWTHEGPRKKVEYIY